MKARLPIAGGQVPEVDVTGARDPCPVTEVTGESGREVE